MKTLPSVLRLLVITAALIAFVFWLATKRTATPPASPNQTNPVPSAEEHVPAQQRQPIQPAQQTGSLAPANVPANAPTDTNTAAPPLENKAEQMANVLSNYNDMPIAFYGKIEDQFSNAVPGAAVSFEIQYNTGYDAGVKRGTTTSDARGFFTITGYTGKNLSTNPKKPGYALASKNGGGVYSLLWPEEARVHPDPNNPVVIKMWKLQGAEPLVRLDHKFKLPYSDAPIYFDLLAGKVLPAGGDLKITVTRAPGVMSGASRLDWSVRIEAVAGGLMDSAGLEETTYCAPTEGYQPTITIAFSPSAWNGGFNRGFFVMSRGGQVYSKLGLTFTINQKPEDPMYIAFGGVASTNGSRNWEGDPNTLKPQ